MITLSKNENSTGQRGVNVKSLFERVKYITTDKLSADLK